jgi:inorganic pyrophosphatase
MIKTKEIVIEQPKGSYKSFEIQGDQLWKDYPLEGMTYPVNYGYVK